MLKYDQTIISIGVSFWDFLGRCCWGSGVQGGFFSNLLKMGAWLSREKHPNIKKTKSQRDEDDVSPHRTKLDPTKLTR